jgi:hypothetical protein
LSGRSLRTFDVFDTAIVRFVIHPDHLHWRVGAELRAKGLIDLSPQGWRSARIEAEARARRASLDPEVTLAEIFDELAKGQVWDAERRAQALQVELDIERQSVSPVTSISARFAAPAQAGSDTAFVSDTYFDKSFVRELLESCGYPETTLFCSSDYMQTKWDGKLFDEVLSSTKLGVESITHIGDNYRSDVLNPRRSNIIAEHFTQSAANFYEKILFKAGGENYLSSAIAGSARAARLSGPPGDEDRAGMVKVAAGVVGPLLLGYVFWIIDDARRRGLERLYFLARDGQILTSLANKVLAWAGLDMRAVYMMASRRAFYMPSLPAQAGPAIEQVIAEGLTKPVDVFLDELDFDAAEVGELIRAKGLPPSGLVGDAREVVEAILMENAPALVDRINARTSAFRAYLDTIGLTPSSAAALIDLGWRGNLQARFERAAGFETFGYYFGLTRFPASLTGRTAQYQPIRAAHPEMLETFCLADHGSVTGFRVEPDGAVAAEYGECGAEGPTLWDVQEQQAVVNRFADIFLKSVDPRHHPLAEVSPVLTTASIRAFAAFLKAPDFDEALAYGSVRHAADQSHSDFREIAPRASLLSLMAGVVDRKRRAAMSYNWFPAVVARSLPIGQALLDHRRRRGRW